MCPFSLEKEGGVLVLGEDRGSLEDRRGCRAGVQSLAPRGSHLTTSLYVLLLSLSSRTVKGLCSGLLTLIFCVLNLFATAWVGRGGRACSGLPPTAAEGVELMELMAELQTLPWTQVGPRFIFPLGPCGHRVTPAAPQAFRGP